MSEVHKGTRAQVKLRLMKASQNHLIDLKRAGHSPTRTELNISHEPGARRIPRRLGEFSFTGSQAAMCADIA